MGQPLRSAEFVTCEVLRARHQCLGAGDLRYSLNGWTITEDEYTNISQGEIGS